MFTPQTILNSMGAKHPAKISVSLFGSGGSTRPRGTSLGFLGLRDERSELPARSTRASLRTNVWVSGEPLPSASVTHPGVQGLNDDHGAEYHGAEYQSRRYVRDISDTLDTCDTLYIKARALGKND